MDNKGSVMNEVRFRNYANGFWKDLTAALWSNKGALELLPIVFVTQELCDKHDDMVYGITHVHTNTATNIATVYPVVYISDIRTNEEIESTIRHEAIHYLLGILYKCHDDHSALFRVGVGCTYPNTCQTR